MSPLTQKIDTLMHTDAGGRPSFIKALMYGLSLVYGAGVKIRSGGYRSGLLRSKKLPCKVVSVGNITAGGTGKTPMTMYLAQRLHKMGHRPAIISRGYRGRAEKTGGIVSNGLEIFMASRSAGDEPFMMATRLQSIQVPVLVGHSRYRSGLLALEKFNPDVIILDDGFQHLGLARDINLVLLDGRRPFGNKFLLPRGALREPLAALERADVFILTRTDSGPGTCDSKDLTVLKSVLKGRRLFETTHKPVMHAWFNPGVDSAPVHSGRACNLTDLKDRKIVAFAGIANNDNFKQTLVELGCTVTGFMGFPDHHPYSENDFMNIFETAKKTGADCLCTTDKDFARIEKKVAWPMDLAVLGVEIFFGGQENDFNGLIKSRLESSTR